MALRFLTQQVVGTSFGVFSDAELRRLSVKRVSSALSFDAFSHAAPDGLYDRALGPSGTDHSALCATCGLNAFECPGHAGHVELCVPVFHPLLFSPLYDLLRRKCFACHRFRARAADSDALRAKLMLLDCGRLAEAMALDDALVVLDAPFFASMVMLATSLDSGAPGLLMAFTPLWLLDAAVGLLLLCHLGLALSRFCCGARSAEDLGVFLFALAFFSLLLVPPMLTLILVAMKEQALGFGPPPAAAVVGAAGLASLSWKRVLAPMLFWLAVATLVSWLLSAGALVTNCVRPWLQARAHQPDPFGSENGLSVVQAGRVVVAGAGARNEGGGA